MPGARPDFHITADNLAGVVDITSTNQLGHIFRKRFSPASFSYWAESYYDTLDIGQPNFQYDDATGVNAQKYMVESANERFASDITAIKGILDLIHSGMGSKDTKEMAGKVYRDIHKVLAKARIGDIAPGDYKGVDDDILILNQQLKNQIEGVGTIVEGIRERFALEGHPKSWSGAPAADQSSTSMDIGPDLKSND